MKRLIPAVLAVLLIGAGIAGCGQSENVDSGDVDADRDKISVVATIFPQYDFVREIAGDNVELTMLLSPGSESHSFEPTPKDMETIQNCDVFIYVGGDSDDWIKGILESVDTQGMKILSLMDMVDVVEEEIVEGMEDDHGHDHDHEDKDSHDHDHDHDDGDDHDHDDDHNDDHDHGREYDEHVWTSPKNAKIIVQAISDVLCQADDANAAQYRENTTAYLAKLDELDTAFKDAVSGGLRKTLVFGDRFPFRYFTDTYGLDYFAALPGCSTHTDVSAATLAFLIDKVADESIPVVFHLELSNGKMADTICEATGAKKMLLHACHNVSKNEFESGVSYLELMTTNVEVIREALQ